MTPPLRVKLVGGRRVKLVGGRRVQLALTPPLRVQTVGGTRSTCGAAPIIASCRLSPAFFKTASRTFFSASATALSNAAQDCCALWCCAVARSAALDETSTDLRSIAPYRRNKSTRLHTQRRSMLVWCFAARRSLHLLADVGASDTFGGGLLGRDGCEAVSSTRRVECPPRLHLSSVYLCHACTDSGTMKFLPVGTS